MKLELKDQNIINIQDYSRSKKKKKILLTFQNYIPRSQSLKKYLKEIPVETANWENQFKQLKTESNKLEIEYDLTPKNIAWDLKRDIAKDLKLLEKKTFLVINEILAERSSTLEENFSEDFN